MSLYSDPRFEHFPYLEGAAKKAVGKVSGKKTVEAKGEAQKVVGEVKEAESKSDPIPVEATAV